MQFAERKIDLCLAQAHCLFVKTLQKQSPVVLARVFTVILRRRQIGQRSQGTRLRGVDLIRRQEALFGHRQITPGLRKPAQQELQARHVLGLLGPGELLRQLRKRKFALIDSTRCNQRGAQPFLYCHVPRRQAE